MAFVRQLLLYSGLIIITATAISVDENPTKSLTTFDYHIGDVVPTHYNISLTPYFRTDEEKDDAITKFDTNAEQRQTRNFTKDIFYDYIYCELNATIDIFRSITKISLNSSNSIKLLSGHLIKINTTHAFTYFIYYTDYHKKTQILDLYFEDRLSRGHYVLNIIFTNDIKNTKVNDTLLLKTVYKQKFGKLSETTDFVTTKTRRFFPFWDNPTIKATFSIFITHKIQYQVISNMPRKRLEIIYQINSTKPYTLNMRTQFHLPAMHAHRVIIILLPLIGKFCTNKIYMWNILYCAKDINFAHRVASKVMMKLQFAWFKNLESPKLQLITILDNHNDIDVHAGVILIRENSSIYDKNVHSIAQKIEVAQLIARGVAYQWFGNLIDFIRTSRLWLHDGFTILFGIDVLDAVNALEDYQNSKMMDLFVVQLYESFNSYDLFYRKFLSQSNNSFIINSYFRYKASLIFRMMQHLLTKKVFWKGVNRYLHMQHSALNWTTFDDFWTVMQTTIEETNSELSKNIGEQVKSLQMLINEKSFYMYCPILNVTRNYIENYMNITIINYNTIKRYNFTIPITFTTENNLNCMSSESFHDNKLIFIREKKLNKINIKTDGWVMLNLQQTGYYRINYDFENWIRIANYMVVGNYMNIHVLNRAKLIDDAFYFLRKKKFTIMIYVSLISYLGQETNYIPWYSMIKALEYLSIFLPFSHRIIDYMKEKLNKMFDDLLLQIKYEEILEEEDFTKCLRQEAIKWACILDNMNCQQEAHRRLINRIENRETNKLLPWWEEWIYCKGLMLSNLQTWLRIQNMAIASKNAKFRDFLACSQNVDVIKHIISNDLLFLMLHDDRNWICSKISEKNCVNSFLFIVSKLVENDNVLRYILYNFLLLRRRNINGIAVITIIINNVYTVRQLNTIGKKIPIDYFKLQAFDNVFKANKNPVNATQMAATLTEQWIDNIKNKTDMRISEINKHLDYF